MGQFSHELVLPRPLWERSMRELLLRPDRAAVGFCRRNVHGGIVEFLVDGLTMRADMPRGADQPLYCDWVVVGSPTGSPGENPVAWVEQLEPRGDQTLIVALLGLGPERNAWDGIVVEKATLRPLAGIQIPGPHMLHVRRSLDELAEPTSGDRQAGRFSRTVGALTPAVHELLQSQSVLLLGAGRTGSAIAYQLVALGIRKLAIADPDHLGRENLDAMYAVREADVGRPKARVIQERLLEFRSDCTIAAITDQPDSAAIIDQARATNLILTCVDRDSGRLAGALLANRFLKTHLDIGTGIHVLDDGTRETAADIRLLVPGEGCIQCVGGMVDQRQARDELFSHTLPPAIDWRTQRAGSLIALNGLAVSTGVMLWLDLLKGELHHSAWHRLLWRHGHGLQVNAASVAGANVCPVCHPVHR